MPRHYDDSQQHVSNSKATRRQQEDQRRMEFRRAIESYSEQRQLAQELSDYFDLASPDTAINVWQQRPAASRRNAQQVG